MIGTLKMVSSRGFGFISYNHIDYFFHHSAYDGDWQSLTKKYADSETTGEKIKLEFENDPEAPQGPRAKNVKNP